LAAIDAMSRNNELKVSGCQGNSKQGIRLSGYQNWNSRRFFSFLPSYWLVGIITSNNKASFSTYGEAGSGVDNSYKDIILSVEKDKPF